MKHLLLGCLLCWAIPSFAGEVTIIAGKRYLNLPVSHQTERAAITFEVDGVQERRFVIRLAPGEADYWVFCDLSALQGKTIKVSYEGDSRGLENIYQSDEIAGADSLYKETLRPQLHFTTQRGWINDPNGLVYYEGEYHLFYQHNPYEREWENMHWGHAISRDLVHWEQLPEALYPDRVGTMFSGSAVIDYYNTAGFNRGDEPAMVAIYTAASPAKQVQCIAYSLDRGRSFTKYIGNPVIDSKQRWNHHDTRDPKVFWYEPSKRWVMVLNEAAGHSIYTSRNLRQWDYQSHIDGFWECPELFALPVDGDLKNMRWVIYDAIGAYRTGSFDGFEFLPKSEKLRYSTGAIYAAQTYTNIPEEDGRRIQVGWGRVEHPGMPFNHLMLLPTELTLRTTPGGICLFSYPVKEIETLEYDHTQREHLSTASANEVLAGFGGDDLLRIRATVDCGSADKVIASLAGQPVIERREGMVQQLYRPGEKITLDVIVDRTAIEVFLDGGAFSYAFGKNTKAAGSGFSFADGVFVESLEVCRMHSIHP